MIEKKINEREREEQEHEKGERRSERWKKRICYKERKIAHERK